jgi:hypothetical protein
MNASKRVGQFFVIMLAIAFACMMFSGCPLPVPNPVPGPTPAPADAAVIDAAPADVPAVFDPFKDQAFDCHLAVVAAQYTEASPKVGDCLTAPPLACLVRLASSYDINTVACLVRDLGFAANNAVLAGTASGNDGTVAMNVRIFINAEDLGFK